MQRNHSTLTPTHAIMLTGKYTDFTSTSFVGTYEECEANLRRRERLNSCDTLIRAIVPIADAPKFSMRDASAALVPNLT